MYQRIKAALIRPRSNINYVKDRPYKFVIYIIIFVVLFTLPYIPILVNVGSTFADNLAKNAVFKEEISYEIKDNKLSPIGEAKTHVISFNSSALFESYIVIGNDIDKSFSNLKQVLLIHFDNDGIYFMNRDGANYLKILDYDDKYIDLRKLDDGDRPTLNNFFAYFKTYINNHLGLVYGIGIPVLLVFNTISVLGIALFISVVGLISFRSARITFKESFKLTILTMAPVVITFMFSVFLKRSVFGNLLYWAGLIISSIYYYRLGIFYILVRDQKINEENKI